MPFHINAFKGQKVEHKNVSTVKDQLFVWRGEQRYCLLCDVKQVQKCDYMTNKRQIVSSRFRPGGV